MLSILLTKMKQFIFIELIPELGILNININQSLISGIISRQLVAFSIILSLKEKILAFHKAQTLPINVILGQKK